MHAGVGSVSGRVFAESEPAGGITVTTSNGDTTFTTSTLTAGDVGFYNLPQLPIPGDYTVTVDGRRIHPADPPGAAQRGGRRDRLRARADHRPPDRIGHELARRSRGRSRDQRAARRPRLPIDHRGRAGSRFVLDRRPPTGHLRGAHRTVRPPHVLDPGDRARRAACSTSARSCSSSPRDRRSSRRAR